MREEGLFAAHPCLEQAGGCVHTSSSSSRSRSSRQTSPPRTLAPSISPPSFLPLPSMAPTFPTYERKQSWASEVEEDEDTSAGWDAFDSPSVETHPLPLPAFPAASAKSKKSKHRKKPNRRKPENEPPPATTAAAAHAETEFRSLAVSVQAPSQHKALEDDDQDGWQVSSSRRTRHQQSNQTFSASGNNIFGSVARATSGRIPVPTSCAARQTPHQNPKNHLNCADGPPNVTRQVPQHHLKNPLTCIDGPPNVSGNEPMNRRPPKLQAQAPKSSILENQMQAVRDNTDHAVSSWARVAERNTRNSDLDILSKLLPSENVAPIQFVQTGSNAITSNSRETETYHPLEIPEAAFPADSESACSDADLEDDSDWIGSDSFDSDASVKSLDTRKRNKGFHNFFQTLDDLRNDQILEVDRQWHCPVCRGGVGAIDWYRGLPPLIAHAKTYRTKRVGLHREFARVLEEELEMRRAGTGVCETKLGKWKGLQNDEEKDPNIVWPPMVIVQNTQYERDDQEKWIGMGNKELLDMFSEYSPMKARHSYGPQGHRGMSVVIFADSPAGYYNAELLAKHFRSSRKGRADWENPGKIIVHPGGNRILYGYMPTVEDMEVFNRHSVGKTKLKWELRKYKDAVTQPMKQMDEENQQLHYYKSKMQKQMEHSKTLERSVSVFSKKLELREKEIAAIRRRAMELHEENQKEVDGLERCFKERITQMQRESEKKEQEVKKKQEEFKLVHIERCQQLKTRLENEQQEPKQTKMKEEMEQQTDILERSLKESEDLENEKRELQKRQHLRKREFLRNQYEQLLSLEEEFKEEMHALLEKYISENEEETSKAK